MNEFIEAEGNKPRSHSPASFAAVRISCDVAIDDIFINDKRASIYSI